MSRCGQTELLESLVLGELSTADSAALRSHSERCQRCRHELRWLETEQLLFRSRGAEQAVQPLIRPERRRIPSLIFAAAASLLITSGISQLINRGTSWSSADASVINESQGLGLDIEVATEESRESPPQPTCSQLPEGVGFHCTSPASFLAVR